MQPNSKKNKTNQIERTLGIAWGILGSISPDLMQQFGGGICNCATTTVSCTFRTAGHRKKVTLKRSVQETNPLVERKEMRETVQGWGPTITLYKWPYKWVNGVITLLVLVTVPLWYNRSGCQNIKFLRSTPRAVPKLEVLKMWNMLPRLSSFTAAIITSEALKPRQDVAAGMLVQPRSQTSPPSVTDYLISQDDVATLE